MRTGITARTSRYWLYEKWPAICHLSGRSRTPVPSGAIALCTRYCRIAALYCALLLALTTLACRATERGSDTALQRADAAYNARDVAAAERGYLEVLEADSSRNALRRASVMLGWIAWHDKGDSVTAKRHFSRSIRFGETRLSVLTDWARMELSQGNFAAALHLAMRAEEGGGVSQSRLEELASVEAAALVRLLRTEGATASRAVEYRRLLPSLIPRLMAMVARSPGEGEPARQLVELAALGDDGEALLMGWQSSYLLADAMGTTRLLTPYRQVLEMRLPGWHKRPHNEAERLAIAHALAGSRFFAAAVSFVEAGSDAPRPVHTLARGDSIERDVRAYAAFLTAFERITIEYYRTAIIGHPRRRHFTSELTMIGAQLWQGLVWSGAIPPFTLESLWQELRRRFGTVIRHGRTGRYFDVLLGHVIIEQSSQMRLQDQSFGMDFVVVDQMAAAGIEAWADGSGARAAGWQKNDTLFMVAPASPPEWPCSGIPPDRGGGAILAAHWHASIDSILAFLSPSPSLAGVYDVLYQQGLRHITDSLSAAGLRDASLGIAICRAYVAARRQSLLAHEGRHLLDERQGVGRGSADLEFRAKVSEVSTALEPRLSFGGFRAPWDSTPHGRANIRVARELLHWMRLHKRELAGVDTTAPLLPQLLVLKDADLRSAFASFEPNDDHGKVIERVKYLGLQLGVLGTSLFDRLVYGW